MVRMTSAQIKSIKTIRETFILIITEMQKERRKPTVQKQKLLHKMFRKRLFIFMLGQSRIWTLHYDAGHGAQYLIVLVDQNDPFFALCTVQRVDL